MKNSPWFIAAIVLVLEIILIAVIVPGDYTGRTIVREQELIENSLGKTSLEWVQEKADAWYQTTMIDSGVKSAIYNHLIPTEEQKAKSVGLETFGDWWFDLAADRIESVMLVIQQTYLRFALLLLWAPYILLLLIPAVYDGIQTWRIKFTNFDYASPVVHRYSARLMGICVVGMMMLLIAPVAIPPVTTPVILMIICVATGLVIGNYQKRI